MLRVSTSAGKRCRQGADLCRKYFLLKQFNVPTDQDDPDAFQQKVESSKPPEMITQEQRMKFNRWHKAMLIYVEREV
ncbi:ERF family protein [Bacillus licheniformis]|nr:ERF family protein [Bacillus licheniformis]